MAFNNTNPYSTFIEEANNLISNYNEQIAKEKEEEQKRKIANATRNMRTQYDEVRGVTWYYDKSTPKYRNRNSFHIYFGKRDSGQPWLRFVIQYYDDDWLFIERYIIKADDKIFRIEPNYGEVERDNNADIWEWIDITFSNREAEIVNAVINSKKTIIRFEGSQYYDDRIISSTEKQALKNVLEAYEALGGSLNSITY